jgi:hypothetical protein
MSISPNHSVSFLYLFSNRRILSNRPLSVKPPRPSLARNVIDDPSSYIHSEAKIVISSNFTVIFSLSMGISRKYSSELGSEYESIPISLQYYHLRFPRYRESQTCYLTRSCFLYSIRMASNSFIYRKPHRYVLKMRTIFNIFLN